MVVELGQLIWYFMNKVTKLQVWQLEYEKKKEKKK